MNTKTDASIPISVVLPAHNAERFIVEALDSLRRQTVQPEEVIVVDDASTDTTPDILGSYDWDRVRVVTMTTNVGAAKARNRGNSEAKHDWIACMDADDICHPERFERLWGRLQADPSLIFLGSGMLTINAVGDLCGGPFRSVSGAHNVAARIYANNCIIQGSCIYLKEAWEAAGGYRTEEEPAADYGLWLRMVRLGPMDNLPDILFYVRKHGAQMSAVKLSPQVAMGLKLRTEAAQRVMKEELNAVRDRLDGPVYIYGASGTGQRCAMHLRSMGVEVAALIDNAYDSYPALPWPVIRPDALDRGATGAMVIGSFAHQNDMADMADVRWPRMWKLSLYKVMPWKGAAT